MKRSSWFVFAGSVFAVALSLHAQSFLPVNERLESPAVSGMATGITPAGWGWFDTIGGGSLRTDGMTSTTAHSGSQSLFFTTSESQGASYESIYLHGTPATLNLNPGDQVTCSIWVRSDAANPYSGDCVNVVVMEFHNSSLPGNGLVSQGLIFVNPPQMPTDGWAKFSVTASPTAFADNVVFVIKAANFSGESYLTSSGTFYVDDLQMSVLGQSSPSNILNNPGFETGGLGWVQVHPQGDGGNVFDSQAPNHGGAVVYKCWGNGTATNTQAVIQDRPAAAGNTYVASGFARNGNSGDIISFPSQFWLQVDFLDAQTNVLTSYESLRLGSTANTFSWTRCDITNRVDPQTRAVIGTASSLVAPAGSKTVRFTAIYSQNAAGGGSVHFDDLSLNQTSGNLPPMIWNIIPDGSLLLNSAADGFRFYGTSTVTNLDASGVQLILNGLDVSAGLVVEGSGSSNLMVSYAGLQPNRQYNALIHLTDAVGLTASSSVTFDTYAPANFIVEAEDYDYGSGLYINNPVPASAPATNNYLGRSGTANVDYYESDAWGGNLAIRESYGVGPGIDASDDVKRYKFIDAGNVPDYSVGWIDGGLAAGDWLNYRRDIPAGTYNIFCRLAGPDFGQCQVAQVTSGFGTANQTTNILGTASFQAVPGAAYRTWVYAPVLDANNHPVKLTCTSPTNITFRLSAYNANIGFFMLVPPAPKSPVPLAIVRNGIQRVISFPSESGAVYTLEYTADLAAGTWTELPPAVTGDGSIKSFADSTPIINYRYYRVRIE